MRSGVRFTLAFSLALASAAGCDPFNEDHYSLSDPEYLGGAGRGGGGSSGGGGKAGGGGEAGGAGLDVVDRLRLTPGVADVEELEPKADGARRIAFTIEQPVDHDEPKAGAFAQRVHLVHRGEAEATVLASTGYFLFAPRPSDSEISILLGGNNITVEHRFFGPSTPLRGAGEPPAEAWAYLTIEQAAADHHRVVEALKPIYKGTWLSTGASKGGMTSVYHRRFYPDDVEGTVAYVAPQSYGTDDQRYVAFLEQVGDAACRERIVALQRDLLTRRAEARPAFDALAAEEGLTFEHVGGPEAAYEHIVQEFRFAFWQYGDPAECETLPAPGAPIDESLGVLAAHVPLSLASDGTLLSVDGFAGYYHQTAAQLGSYGPLTLHLEDLLQFPETYSVEVYAPPVPGRSFDPAPMLDVGDWLASEGERFLFIYGEYDPWSAGAYAFAPGAGRDLHTFVVPGGNHGAFLTHPALPAASRDEAFAILQSWTGVAPALPPPPPAPSVERSSEPAWVHLAPGRPRL
ncbi:MAG TPA: S28 family serine protease [Polyangiaceae bacterium]|nr:S28 family serine protease [Polyangiaceae bacterium]